MNKSFIRIDCYTVRILNLYEPDGAFIRKARERRDISMDKRANYQKKNSTKPTFGAYKTQAISQPDERQAKTHIAMPDEDNVSRARNWVDENKK